MAPAPPSQVDGPRVLFAVSEYAPVVKTGGLGDVAGALPRALRALGVDLRVVLPGYPAVLAAVGDGPSAPFDAEAGLPAHRLRSGTLPDGVPAYVVDCAPLYVRDGGPYQDPQGRDWPDNALRFGLLGRVAARLGAGAAAQGWRADVVHAHDWQAGLAPAYLRLAEDAGATRTLTTIHNLAFPGLFDRALLDPLALPAAAWSMHGVEFFGRLSFLKAGLYYADAITTVSPTYAREIQTKAFGMGFEGLLAGRRDALHGILNGIDTDVWDPGRDPWIAQAYGVGTIGRKAANKRALQQELGLAPRDDAPLFAVVSRLTQQKGVDLVVACENAIVLAGAQLAVLGTGERATEAALRGLAARHPQAIAATIGFDEALAHRIEAGADAFLMPSRFEPCGMNQMYSQRYGTPPIVHATGGLADSVVDCTPRALADGTATGFTFTDASPTGLLAAIVRCVAVYRDPPAWRQLMRNGMARDFSWRRSAAQYASLYATLAAHAAA